MKRFLLFITVSMLLASCGNYGIEATLTLDGSMVGMEDGDSTTHAVWGEKESVHLFNTEDWMPSTFAMLSEGGGSTAEFQGVIITAKNYRGLRGKLLSVKGNGEALLRVGRKNIFLAEENSADVAPMVASGRAAGVTFTSIFGAVKFVVDESMEFDKVEVEISNSSLGMNGDFLYNISQNVVKNSAVSHKASRTFSSPLNLSTTPIYVSLPASEYSLITILVSNNKTHKRMRYTLSSPFVVKQNKVLTLSNLSSVEVPAHIGTWRLVSIFGKEVDVNLYISLFEDNTFKLYQRTEADGYATFEGTYSYDKETSTLSGVYSDGTAWANSYRVELGESGELRWVNLSDESEVSIYESADAPTAGVQSRGASVKPLL